MVEVENIGDRIDNIDEELDVNKKLIDGIQKDVGKLAGDVETVNSALKKSLNKVRAPNKLCMDLTLSFVLAMLIGVLLWLIPLVRG